MTNEIIQKSADTSFLRNLRKDPIAVEKQFNSMSFGDQVNLFMMAGDRDRLTLVEISHKPRELLKEVPATELWFTIKRLTPEDSLDLIKYSSPEQIQVIGDIEWWRKDRLENSSMIEWLGYIASCGHSKIMEWFRECDWEEILWFFKKNIIVYKKEDKDEDPADAIIWPREESPITHEGVYYFQVVDEKSDQLIRHLLEILAKHDLNEYHKICEASIWDAPSIREEEAYEIKSRRLAEHGFPSFDESIGIYQPLDKNKIKFAKKRPQTAEKVLAPRYPLTVMGDRVLFLNRVLSEIKSEDEGRFLVEAANIANKVLVADGKEISEENLIHALVKAIGYVNIGLEVLSGGDVAKAAGLVSEYWLVTIFQIGWDEVLKLARKAEKIFKNGWPAGSHENLELLETPERLAIENLLLKRPLYFTGGGEYDPKNYRDFTSTDEIDSALENVRKTDFFGRLIEELVSKNAAQIMQMIDYPADIRFTGIIFSMFVNSSSVGHLKSGPVSRDALKTFLKKINLEKDEESLNEELESFKGRIKGAVKHLTQNDLNFLDYLLDEAKLRFITEFKGVLEPPEPQFIRSVWTA